MVRKFVSATVSAALCLMSAAPAMAQDYRFAGFDAPRGATATVNLRVPLGNERARPTYGLTFSYGQELGPLTYDGRTRSRAVNVADLRFAGDELRNARIATFDLANLEQDRRMNMVGTGKKTWLILGILIAAGIILCVTELCEDDEEDEPDSPSTQG